MFPFWDEVVAPLIRAVGPRRVVEIGALRGETTVRVLQHLAPECELHVIDPLPQFDPAEHERAFPGRYVFHRGISHDVLPGLPAADVALVDGDHNWFTVYHELRMLAAAARAAGEPLPVLVLHDVGWPYGRRDLYYEPDRIPEAFRQPYRRAGMRPGVSHLFPRGGMNITLANAEHEGGPRNGVMTALEDFVAEHDRPLRQVVLPIYYGLAIVVEEDRLSRAPEVAAVLDRFEGEAGQRALVAMAERIRLDEAIFGQAWVRTLQQQRDRAADRQVEVVKAALLDEHYLDDEVRVEYLLSLVGMEHVDPHALRDPARFLPVRYQRLAQARAAGVSVGEGRVPAYHPYTDMGRAQLDRLEAALAAVVADGVEGDVAEVGAGQGGGAILLRAALDAHEVADRVVWVADRFAATADEGDAAGQAPQRFRADLNQVRDGFARFGVLDDRVRFIQGSPTDTLRDAPIERLALLRLGEALGTEVGAVLELLHRRLAPGAAVVVAGTADARVARAVETARASLGMRGPIERVDANAWTWRVPLDAPAGTAEGGTASPAVVAARPPLAPPAPTDAAQLTVVVVFHDMRREAARTLHSLSRAYQRDIEDLDYEVIAIDNGSSPDQRLDAAFVAAFGPQFRLLSIGDDAHPSPTVALNAGIAAARGESLALMIDGAHVLTPRVLHYGMAALSTYAPAVVATQQWYLGPGQQGDAQQFGYDQHAEDRLFARIKWPSDGYRLFEIGHFIGERDWFDGIVESNCLFVPRRLLEQLGGFDDSFSMPGGGYANLDLFERLGLAPGVRPATILGEGTFHQFHGGTTTNVADDAVRRDRVASYGAHFTELRGRPLIGLDRPVHYVGAIASKAARRTRSRRDITLHFDAMRDPAGDATAAPPVPVPDEVKMAAIEAVWDRQAWRDATWLGHRVNRFPTDLHIYQELLAEQRPGVVVLCGDDDGLAGRALLAASVCDLVGDGAVVAVGRSDAGARPAHPRIVHVDGDAATTEVAERVLDLAVGRGPATVFLGLGEPGRVVSCFQHYSPLVPVGGYVVIENTVVNGHPSAPSFGAGPHEAAVRILASHHDFLADLEVERYTVTFNRGGYLRRVR